MPEQQKQIHGALCPQCRKHVQPGHDCQERADIPVPQVPEQQTVIEVDLGCEGVCAADTCPLHRWIIDGYDGDGYSECSGGAQLKYCAGAPAPDDCPLRAGPVLVKAKE
jgi:hypothetical protein